MANPDPNVIMFDALEQIKVAAFGCLQNVDGFLYTYRNRGRLVSKDPETQAPLLPAGIMLDGYEEPMPEDKGLQGQSRRGQMPPITVYWYPQFFIVLMPRETVDNVGVGEELSAFRAKVHKNLVTNKNLLRMLGDNGGITYLGYDSDMQQGNDLRGQMRLDYRFAYVFDPSLL